MIPPFCLLVVDGQPRLAGWRRTRPLRLAGAIAALAFAVRVSAGAQHPYSAPGRAQDVKTYIKNSEVTEEPASPAASALVPLESWVYPAFVRLAALGYADTAFLGLRPWTRSECARLVEESEEHLDADPAPRDVVGLVNALRSEFAFELGLAPRHRVQLDSVYVRTAVISGAPLTDSYHFGQTATNDYGRPYAEGWNQLIGFSGRAHWWRFALAVRGEYQHAPSRPADSASIRAIIAAADATPLLPPQAAPARNRFRLIDANVSATLGGLQFSLGKQSLWWGPGESGAMILSNNAEPFYMLRITRTSPLQLPWVFAYLGPIRTDSFFGRLQGHRFPPAPFFYGQKISLKPIPSLEVGFSRTVVFAGQGVTPLTFSTFWHSFSSATSGTPPGFDLRRNPGARHASFDFSYRLPGLRRWGVTLYSDSVSHDDVSPVSAPRRAAINPGVYIARLPRLPRFDLRMEAVSTDPPTTRSNGGKFLYWQGIYRDAYMNKGALLGSWIGREAKGGQAWMSYWLNPQARLQVSYRRAKLAKDFIPGGGTQNDWRFDADIRLRPSLRAAVAVQYERWAVPALAAQRQSDVTAGFTITWLNIGSARGRP